MQWKQYFIHGRKLNFRRKFIKCSKFREYGRSEINTLSGAKIKFLDENLLNVHKFRENRF